MTIKNMGGFSYGVVTKIRYHRFVFLGIATILVCFGLVGNSVSFAHAQTVSADQKIHAQFGGDFGDDEGNFGGDEGDGGDFGGGDGESETGDNTLDVIAIDGDDVPLVSVSVFAYCGGTFDEASTDADGLVSLTDLGDGNCFVQLNSNFGYMSDMINVSFAQSDTPQTKSVTLVGTEVNELITVNVEDADGNAVDGMVVSLIDKVTGRYFNAQTENGVAQIRLNDGTYQLTGFVDSETNYLEDTEITVSPTNTTFSITLQEYTSFIEGTARALSSGSALSNSTVLVFGDSDIRFNFANSSGQYSVGVRPGTYRVKFEKSGYGNTLVSNVVVGNNETVTDVDGELETADNDVTITTVDADGNPLSLGAMLFCKEPTGDEASVYIRRLSSGSASISFPDGTFACSVMADGYVMLDSVEVTVSGGETVSEQVVLVEYDSTITVTVQDQDGNSITDARLGVVGISEEGYTVNGFGDNTGLSMGALAGTYSVRAYVVSGNYTFAPGSEVSVNVASGETEEVTLTLYSTGSMVSGVVEDANGNSVADAKVTLTASDDSPFEFSTTTDANGNYSMDVVPGDYTLLASSENFSLPSEETDVTVSDDDTLNKDISLQDTTATLRVTPSEDIDSGDCYAYKSDGSYVTAPVNDGIAELAVNGGNWTYGCRAVSGDEIKLSATEGTSKISNGATKNVTADFDASDDHFDGALFQFSATSDATFSLPDGTQVYVPANTLDTSGNVTIMASVATSTAVSKEEFPAKAIQFTALDSNNKPIEHKFNNAVTVTFAYDENALGAIGLQESDLRGKSYAHGGWSMPQEGFTVNTETNRVAVTANHFSAIGILGVKGSVSVAKPGRPRKLSVNKIATEAATLHWNSASGTVNSYRIQLRRAGSTKKNAWRKFKNISLTKKRVQKLTIDTKYEFRVRACNSGGCGGWAQWKKFRTKTE